MYGVSGNTYRVNNQCPCCYNGHAILVKYFSQTTPWTSWCNRSGRINYTAWLMEWLGKIFDEVCIPTEGQTRDTYIFTRYLLRETHKPHSRPYHHGPMGFPWAQSVLMGTWESLGSHGFHWYPWIPLVPKGNHGFPGSPWNPWVPMDPIST
jgi:lipopolysaccharide biosynthesis glycosyltransferase